MAGIMPSVDGESDGKQYVSSLGRRGVITVPKPLRDKLGIDEGTIVEQTELNGGILIRPVQVTPKVRINPEEEPECESDSTSGT